MRPPSRLRSHSRALTLGRYPIAARLAMPQPSVLVTRNLKSFKTLPSPLGALHERLFHHLAQPASVASRAAFAPASGAGVPDAALQELFRDPPQISLVQGNADPSHILDRAPKPGASSTLSSSSRSFLSGNSSERPGGWNPVCSPEILRD